MNIINCLKVYFGWQERKEPQPYTTRYVRCPDCDLLLESGRCNCAEYTEPHSRLRHLHWSCPRCRFPLRTGPVDY